MTAPTVVPFDIDEALDSLYDMHERLFHELQRLRNRRVSDDRRRTSDDRELTALKFVFDALTLTADLAVEARRTRGI